jgi:hypothetical protein
MAASRPMTMQPAALHDSECVYRHGLGGFMGGSGLDACEPSKAGDPAPTGDW